MKKLLFFAFSISFIIACENENISPGHGVELYLLKSFDLLQNDKRFQIDESTIITKSSPLIYYSDIQSYDSSNHVFQISENARSRISEMDFPVSGIAFAVKADNKLVYTGYFWPGYSSSSCDWMIIDPTQVEFANEMKVTAGYPGENDKLGIPDKRNDPLIVDILKRDKKLSD